MTGYKYLSVILTLTLLLASPAGPVRASTLPNAEPASPETTLPETLQGIPEATDGWWAAVQEDIRQSEYHITWQEHIYLADLPATSASLGAGAYQAPNRAHNLRTYFAPAGVRLIPRVFEGETPPWEWGLTLTGFGYTGDVQPVTAATLQVDENRIEYQRGDPSAGSGQALIEWYVNDERGLEQGFTLPTAPQSTIRNPQSEIVLDLALSGNLTAALGGGGQTIEFSTAPSTGSGQNGGVRVLSYGELVVYDAAGRQLPSRLSLSHGGEGQGEGGIRIAFDATGALYPITIDPLATSPNWTAESDQVDANFGYSVRTAGDVNGDGYSDVIVGAPDYDDGQNEEGRAYVYHGSPTGLSTTDNWTAESDQIGARFGYSVGTAGDVNGDGYSDVIVGAPLYNSSETDEGWAYVYHGSATGLSTTADWTAESDQTDANFGNSVGTAGDVNGDGYSDVIVGAPLYNSSETDEGWAYVYHGSATGLSTTADWTAESDQTDANFGNSVGTAGDVNGDGYSDVIVGAPYYDSDETDEGRAYVYHGSASGLAASTAWNAESDLAGANFGWSVGTAGDVNGDGYCDVIVGAPLYDSDETDEGRAYVYHGSASGLAASAAWNAESDLAGANFGWSVSTAGDVNGDGYSDVIVGAPLYDNGETDEGRAYVYHGSMTGLSNTSDWTAESDLGGASFGYSVGTVGDVNGDGFSDVIVGAPYYTNDQTAEGRAYVYHGSATGLATTADWTAESDQDGASFGYSVGTAGDVNGDGYSDVIVGARYYDNGHADEGAAYVYHGSAAGLSTTADWIAESNQAFAYFGTSVGTAGDVNGDGYSDVIVGAPRYDNGHADEGVAYIYHGSASGLSSTAAWIAESDLNNARFGHSVGTAGDVNGDGYSDVIVGAPRYDNPQFDEGRAYVYHGSAAGLSTTADWTADSDQVSAYFGYSVGTAGDVNGDGYSDVIVGAYEYTNVQTDEGRTYVYRGSATGLSATADWIAESDQGGALFGWSVGTAGDVNGDGYSDVIVGARYYDNGETNEGRAYVYHGSAVGLSTTDAWNAESDYAYAYFSQSVGTAGDVNGDGYSDVIVGAPYYTNGQSSEGRTYVYHGSAVGLSTTDAWNAESDQVNANFGYSAGAAGDVNGDGYSDVIVGAPYYENGQAGEGCAFVYYGNGGDGLHLLPRQVRSDGSAPIAHLGRSDSHTAFQLSLIGRMPLGREDVRLQWQVAPLGTPITATTGVISGTSGWTDVLTTGVEISQTITVTQGAPYHWRVRLLYRPGNALGQPAGRWVHIPWAGWNETDFRTTLNQPPEAGAGPDQAVGTNALVTLDGSGSSDPDGDLPLAYNWTQTGGTAVTFTPALSVTTFTAPPDPVVLTFTLVVTDSLGLPDPTPDEVVVTVGNQPPVAAAGSDQAVDTNALVTLDGSGSSDPDGDLPLAYNWTQTGGTAVIFTPGLSVTTFTAPSDPAVLTFTLVVTDSLGLPDPTPDEVVVSIANQPPEADAGSDQAVDTNALVTLDGSDSSDPDGDLPLTYHWTQTGGPAVTFTPVLSVTTFTALSDPATMTFTLVVTDSLGLPDPTPDEVVVSTANQPPVAAAGPDQAMDTNALVTLDGSGSSDPDGDLPLTYNWTQIGGTTVAFTPVLSVTTFTAPSDPEVLTFTLVVTDSLGLPDPTPDEVVVTVGNQPPEADAGLDQAVDTNALVTLDGSGSSDPDGNMPLTYNWTQTGGTAVTFTPVLSVTTFTAPSNPAVLTFTLVVTDSLGLPDPTPDEVVVSIANQPPEADAGPDQAVDTNALVTLDGSGSSDPDGDLPLSYNWTQTGGTAVDFTPALSVTTFTAPSDPAVLTFTLVVTDSLGLPDPTPDGVVVTIANQPPEAYAGLDQAVGTNVLVTLDGSGSSDPDGDLPLTYHWTQTGGTAVDFTPALSVTTFTAPSDPAVLTFTLVVTDSLGLPDPTPDEVVVSIANQPPEADAGSDQAVGTNALVTLDGSGSSDPDGDLPLFYNWTQTGGTAVTLSDPAVVKPTFTAPSDPAVLTFALVVTDNLGLPDPTPDEVVVTVGNQPPEADAGSDNAVDTNALVTLDGSGSSDPDGDLPLAYYWTQTGGPAVTLSDPAVVKPTFTAPSDPAELTFELVVTDSLGLPDPTPDEVVVSIGNQPPVADAEPDQAVDTNALVTLDGSGSSDPDGDLPLAYHWTQTGGPAVTLSDPDVVTPTFTAPSDPAVLTFALVVTDNLGLPDPTPDEVVVTVDIEGYRIYLPLVDTGGTVTPPSGAPVIERFTVEPAVIQLYTCAKVDWAVAGEVTNIKILGYQGGNETVLMANADRTGSFESCPTVIGEVLYKIVATGPGGTVEQQTSIQVQ